MQDHSTTSQPSPEPAAPAAGQYRLYFLQDVGGRIAFSHEFEAGSDELALRISEAWREGRRTELWTGARKVAAWDAD